MRFVTTSLTTALIGSICGMIIGGWSFLLAYPLAYICTEHAENINNFYIKLYRKVIYFWMVKICDDKEEYENYIAGKNNRDTGDIDVRDGNKEGNKASLQ